MKKAQPIHLDNEAIYNGLNAAFTGGNIGIYSNNISKIWNSDVFVSGTDADKKQAIDTIKLLCMENNFVIDYAKTLYKPERPNGIKEIITAYTKDNLPYFFKFAKDKNDNQVVDINESFVNKLNNIIPNPRINCRKIGLDNIDYRLLMNNPDIEFDVEFTSKGKLVKEHTDDLIVKYRELNKTHHFILDNALKVDGTFNVSILSKSQIRHDMMYKNAYNEIKHELSQFGYSDIEIADILVKFLYGIKNSKHKSALWLCYGDILYANLSKNIKKKTKEIQCVDCGKWFETSIKDTETCRCDKCYSEYRKEYYKIKKREQRAKIKMSTAQT